VLIGEHVSRCAHVLVTRAHHAWRRVLLRAVRSRVAVSPDRHGVVHI